MTQYVGSVQSFLLSVAPESLALELQWFEILRPKNVSVLPLLATKPLQKLKDMKVEFRDHKYHGMIQSFAHANKLHHELLTINSKKGTAAVEDCEDHPRTKDGWQELLASYSWPLSISAIPWRSPTMPSGRRY